MNDSQRRRYTIKAISFNRRLFDVVIIDPHYEKKHSKSINDDIILRLVEKADGELLPPRDQKNKYSYFDVVKKLDQKWYRLVFLLEAEKKYIGVVNAFRVDRKEK